MPKSPVNVAHFCLVAAFAIAAVNASAAAGNKRSSRHHYNRLLTKRGDLLGFNYGGDAQVIDECMKIVSQPGRYEFRSAGDLGEPCGVYVVGDADQIVEIAFDTIDVSCRDQGLVTFLDGWEMNRKIFPNEQDHELPMAERITEMCDESARKRRFFSSQNTALVQYSVPMAGEGFTFSVRFHQNPQPCNILMFEMEGFFTLTDFGTGRNCSLTTLLFPANFQLVDFAFGDKKTSEKDCCSQGRGLIEFGGSQSLESRDLLAKETICGCDRNKVKGVTVLCDSATVRLVNHGKSAHGNVVSFLARAAGEQDLDPDTNTLLYCPDYM